MLNLLRVLQFERQIMLERQAEGIEKAKAEGKYKGRKATARMKPLISVALFQAKQTVAEIVRTTGVGRGSVYRVLEAAGLHVPVRPGTSVERRPGRAREITQN